MEQSKDFVKMELSMKELAEQNTGVENKMHSEECTTWTKKHKNCFGCSYEKACSKTVALPLGLMTTDPDSTIDKVLASDNPAQEVNFDFPKPDWNDEEEREEVEAKASPAETEYARSLVGKYCICPRGFTPFLKGLFCKVQRQGDYSRGGNLGQVHILTFRSSGIWNPFGWWVVAPSERDFTICIHSSNLILTDMRPSILDYIRFLSTSIARMTVAWLSTEATFFKYEWWKESLAFERGPLINNLLGALFDTAGSLRNGCYYPHGKEYFPRWSSKNSK